MRKAGHPVRAENEALDVIQLQIGHTSTLPAVPALILIQHVQDIEDGRLRIGAIERLNAAKIVGSNVVEKRGAVALNGKRRSADHVPRRALKTSPISSINSLI